VIHQRRTERFARVADPAHSDGVVGFDPRAPTPIKPISDATAPMELLRPLLEYERLVASRW
jgi:hypothetical protein